MPDTPDLRTEIAAFLAGDLDDAAAAALEARIESEPWVAEAADQQADLLMRLGQVDAVTPPSGFSDRLRAGLAAEIGHDLPEAAGTPDASTFQGAGAAALDGWAGTRRDPARPRSARPDARGRSRTNRRLGALVGAAAAVVVLFVASTTVLTIGSSDDAADSGVEARSAQDEAAFAEAETAVDTAADDSGEGAEDRIEDAADAAMDGDAAGSAALSGPAADSLENSMTEDEASADGAAVAAAPEAPAARPGSADGAATPSPAPAAQSADQPAIVSLGELGSGEQAIRSEVATHPAAERLLGRPANQASELVAVYREQIVAADDLPDGTAPDRCMDHVLEDARSDSIPAVVAAFSADGERRLGYALVRAEDGQVLDHIDVWVVDADSCGVLAVVS